MSSNKVPSRSSSFAMARNKMLELHNSRNERVLSLIDLENVEEQAQQRTKEELVKGYMLITEDEVTIKTTLMIPQVVFAFVANAIAMFNVSFFSSFLAIRFHD